MLDDRTDHTSAGPPAVTEPAPRQVSLSLRQIEVFRAIMVAGSISAAGRMLHVSQPSISRVLALTETRLGYLLFDRNKNRLVPTREARRLYREVEQIYEGIESVNDLAMSLGSSGIGTLKLVSSACFEQRLVPSALRRLYAASPDAIVDFRSATFDQILGHFVSGRADLGISLEPCDNPSLTSVSIGTAELVCIFPKGHRLQALSVITPSDLSACSWISYPANAPVGRVLSGFFGAAPQPPTRIEVHSPLTAVTFVGEGLGVAIVDVWSLSSAVRHSFEVRPLSPATSIPIYATYSTLEALPLAGRRLLKAIKHVIATEPCSFRPER